MPKKIKINLVEPRSRELISFCRQEPQAVIQLLRKLWYFYLRSFIPQALINGQSEYTRFIIIGRARTGSNLLRGSLMSHSRIIVFGDIFRLRNAIHWGIPFYPQTVSMLKFMQNEPIKFLETKVFGKFPSRISAVGFKALYPHLGERWKPVETYLGNQRAFKIIHIKRKNILKSHLSLVRVEQRKGRWKNISGPEEDPPPICLDYDDCLEAFTDTRTWEKEYDNLFKSHTKIDILYEDLTYNYKGEMKRIQDFLGVDYEVVKPLTHKQSGQPLSRAILNYFELKERFKGTGWEEFFED